MPGTRRVKCPDCEGGIPLVKGSGRCSKCFGSGANVSLSSVERNCTNCGGRGVCPTCGGAGVIGRGRLEYEQLGASSGRFRTALALTGAVILLGLGYCGYAKREYLPLATAATEVFHRRFAASQDDLIYFDSDSAWSQAMDAETERKSFARIRRKLGACTYKGPSGWFVNSNTNSNGTLVTLVFQARCANGSMRERFTWRIIAGRALLVAYDPTSKLLLTD